MPVEDIDWIDAAGDYMCVHADNVTHIMRITMKQLEAMLNPLVFLRIHRSTIVNAERISSAQSLTNGEYLLTLQEGTRLKVSRSYRDKIRELTNAPVTPFRHSSQPGRSARRRFPVSSPTPLLPLVCARQIGECHGDIVCGLVSRPEEQGET